MNNKITVKIDGTIEERVKKDGNMLMVDKKRNEIAKKLKVRYMGVLEYKTPFSKKQRPTLQRKVIVQMINGFVLAMTATAFEGKKLVKDGAKKVNSYVESLITEFLIARNVDFLREVSILGYELSDNFKKISSSLSSNELYLLKRLERAIVDFSIAYNNITILLSVEGTLHNKQYDELWKEFSDSGLAAKLGYIYMTLDTVSDNKLKNDLDNQQKFFDKLSKKLYLQTVSFNELKMFEKEIAIKKVLAALDSKTFPPGEILKEATKRMQEY